MLVADLRLVEARQSKVVEIMRRADRILEEQDAEVEAVAAADVALPCEAREELNKAIALYHEALTLQPLQVGALARRAACELALGHPIRAVADATSGLGELDAEEARRAAESAAQSGLFPTESPPPEVVTQCAHLFETADAARIELLRRRAAAHQPKS